MPDDLNLEGIDTSSLFEVPQNPQKLDLSGIDISSLLSPAAISGKKKTPTPSAAFSFRPDVDDFSLNKIASIQDYYQTTFGKSLPLANQGQSGIHNKWGLDHRNAADVSLNPNSAEGKKLMEYLRANNIPFLAFDRAIPGVATSPHIHLGLPSKRTGEQFRIGTMQPSSTEENNVQLDLSGIDISSLQNTETPKLDLKGIDTSVFADVESSLEGNNAIDPSKVAFKPTELQFGLLAKAASGWTQYNRPRVLGKNPDEMGDPIIVEREFKKKPSLNEATDIWLNQWNPAYKEINDRFRAETGGLNIADLGRTGNIVDSDELNAYEKKGTRKYKLQARPTRETVALFEAVKEAYASGQKGMPAFLATGKLSQEQRSNAVTDYMKQQAKIEDYQSEHPWLVNSNLLSAKSAGEGVLEGNLRLMSNLSNLGSAIYTGNVHGYDSQQYLDLINQERLDAIAMQQGESGVTQVEGVVPKIAAGAIRAGLTLPTYYVAGQAGLGSLSALSYFENIHRGNREAALAALPMAIMEGGFHGFNEFLNAGTPKTINTLETNKDGSLKFDAEGDPIPVQKTFTENAGAGNIAPFTRITNKNLSLFQESLVSKAPISIQQLSPLGRQLLLRGTNALLFGGTALITDPNSRNLEDLTSHIVIGFGMPVGKSPKRGKFFDIPEPIAPERIPFQLEQPKVAVGLQNQYTETPVVDKDGNITGYTRVYKPENVYPKPVISTDPREVGNTFVPSYESPTNKYKETTTPIEPNLEKGTQAQITGQTVQLPIDTAALNLINLERAMEQGTWRSKGDTLQDALVKQKAIIEAIEVLKAQIPPEALEFFRKNEDATRAALRSNYDANKAKTDFLERKNESLSLDEIKQTPDKAVEINPNAATPEEVFKTTGINNEDTNRQGAKQVLDTFHKAVSKETGTTFGTGLPENPIRDLTKLTPSDAADFWDNVKDGLSYLNAFFIEDLYSKGIEPTLDTVTNRVNLSLGNAASILNDNQRKEAFQAGINYLKVEPQNTRDELGMFSNVLNKERELPQKYNSIVSKARVFDAEGNARVAVGIDPSLISTLAKNLYSGDIGTIVIKELLQNASDAVKANKQRSYLGAPIGGEKGEVSLDIDVNKRTISIKDNGIGMPPDVMTREFADLGGTLKQAQESSGGYGIAKAAMFFNAENINVVSRYKDPTTGKMTESILSGSAEDWLDTEKGLQFSTKEIPSNSRQGTDVDLKLKVGDGTNKIGMNNYSIQTFLSQFTNTHRLPINFDIKLNGDSADIWNRNNVPTISHAQTIRLPGGDLVIYTSKEMHNTSWPKAMLLNHGLPQKEIGIGVRDTIKLPSTIIIDVKAKGFPKDENYPWRPDREGLRDTAQEALEKYFQEDLVKDAINKERAAYINAIKNGSNINGTTVDPIKKARANTVDITELNSELLFKLLAEMGISEAQMRDDPNVRNEVYSLVIKKTKLEIDKLPVPKKQKVIDTNGTIPKELVDKIASHEGTKKISSLMGNIVNDFIGKLKRHSSSYEDAEYYGIGLGRDYYAVNISGDAVFGDSAKDIILINPYNTIDSIERLVRNNIITYADAPEEMARQLIASVTHELTHQISRGHNESFSSELTNNMGRTLNQQIEGAYKLTKLLGKNEREIYEIIKGHAAEVQSAINSGEDIFSKIASHATTEQTESSGNKTTDLRNEKGKDRLSKGLQRSDDSNTGNLGTSTIDGRYANEVPESKNKITTQQGFDQHRADLVKALENDSNKGDAFNSGLSPDNLIDFLQLTKSDVTDFLDFSAQLIQQFGSIIKPYLNDLWIQTKGLVQHLGEKFDLPLENIKEKFTLNSKELKDSLAYKIRQINENEKGVLHLTKKQHPAVIELQEKREKIPYFEWYGLWRTVGIAQLNVQAGETYNILRSGQRVVNAFESNNLDELQAANKIATNTNNKNIADTIFIGNENHIRYSNAELAAGDPNLNRPALNSEEIKAYNYIRSAEDRTLELRKQHILYGLNERAVDLNNKLQATTDPATQLRLQNSLLDVGVKIAEVNQHYEALKLSGYISTQRSGSIAVEGEDPAFPVGDPKRRLYSQFDSDSEATNWIKEQEANLNAVNFKAYDMKKPQDLKSVAAKLTPGQFEELVDSAGLNSKDPIVEQLREEVYSRFSSMGYSLKRDFIRGYDRDWKFVIDSVARQTETYGRSFYARVAGNEAVKHLESTGLRDSDYSLYQTMQKYIDHEISAPNISNYSKALGGVRKGVYLFQLGYDVNQLYLNALAQPVTQTYSYFSRVRHPETGERLKGLEPEKYFKDGWTLSGRLAKESLQKRTNPNYVDQNIPQEFRDIYDRLSKEHVVSAEFNKSLLKLESEKTVSKKLTPKNRFQKVVDINEHWASAFMRAGEKTTRTQVAAEAYLVGKKFNLGGEELVDFIVRAIDSTQSNPSRAEAPLVVRGEDNKGELRKLLYQFNAFNHMWIENLALNVKTDLENTFDAMEAKANASEKVKAFGKDLVINRGASTIRHLYPLVLMGGIRNLPLAGFSGALYTFLTGDDIKRRFDKIFGKDTMIEQLAMYGMTTSENLGGRLTPSIPFIDNIRVGNNLKSTISESLAVTNIPAVATAAQLGRGLSDLTTRGQRLRGLGEVLPFKPLRNAAITERYREQGIRNRAGRTLVPRSKVSNLNLVGQLIGIAPTKLEENYDRQRSKKIVKLHKKTPLIKKL